jgi:hypothetical protein
VAHSGAGGAIPRVVVTASGAEATVPVAGAVSIKAEIRHLACEFLDALQKFGVVRWPADAGERRRGDHLAICASDSRFQIEFGTAGEGGLYFGR